MLEREYQGYVLKGWCRQKQGEWYSEQIGKIKNGTIVEIGVFSGMSISYIIDNVIQNENKIFAIDPWEKALAEGTEDWTLLKNAHDSFFEFMNKFGFNEFIEVIEDYSENASNRFKDESIDFIYIDGAHSYEHVIQDLTNWYPKLKYGGMMAGDDYDWKSVEEAVKDYTLKNNINFKVYDSTFHFLKTRNPLRINNLFNYLFKNK